MITKINVKFFGIIFLASSIASYAMDNDIVTIETRVKDPRCIIWLHDNIIAIGGFSGIELVDRHGNLISPKFNNTQSEKPHFNDTIYQLLPSKKSWYVAVDRKEYHHIDSFHTGILVNTAHNNSYFFIDIHDNVQPHKNEKSIFDVLIHPHRTSMPKNIETSNCIAVTMYSPQLLALLTRQNIIQFWFCTPNQDNAQILAAVNIDQYTNQLELFPQQLGIYAQVSQRLSFAPHLLHIVVALKTYCFIVPVPAQVFAACDNK